jgi:uncharacterized LabA/DUF88 family protein
MRDKNSISPGTADARARKSTGIRINGIELSNQDLHRELSRNVEALSDLEIEIEKLRSENEQLQERCRTLAARLAESGDESTRPQATEHNASEELSTLREDNQRLATNNARLDKMLDKAGRERAGLLNMLPSGANGFATQRDGLWANQRVAVLVDVQNMYYSARKIYDSKVSFHKLLNTILRNRKLVRAIAYTVEKEGADQTKFYEALERTGFEIKSRDLIERSDGSRKGDWDMGIAIDAISLIERIDVLVLVTGDGDFVALVNMLKSRGVRVEVASFRESTADNLLAATDEHFSIDKRMLVD